MRKRDFEELPVTNQPDTSSAQSEANYVPLPITNSAQINLTDDSKDAEYSLADQQAISDALEASGSDFESEDEQDIPHYTSILSPSSSSSTPPSHVLIPAPLILSESNYEMLPPTNDLESTTPTPIIYSELGIALEESTPSSTSNNAYTIPPPNTLVASAQKASSPPSFTLNRYRTGSTISEQFSAMSFGPSMPIQVPDTRAPQEIFVDYCKEGNTNQAARMLKEVDYPTLELGIDAARQNKQPKMADYLTKYREQSLFVQACRTGSMLAISTMQVDSGTKQMGFFAALENNQTPAANILLGSAVTLATIDAMLSYALLEAASKNKPKVIRWLHDYTESNEYASVNTKHATLQKSSKSRANSNITASSPSTIPIAKASGWQKLIRNNEYEAFIEAASQNSVEVMQFLISSFDNFISLGNMLSAQKHAAFNSALANSHEKALKILCSSITIVRKGNENIQKAYGLEVYDRTINDFVINAIKEKKTKKLELILKAASSDEERNLIIHANGDAAFLSALNSIFNDGALLLYQYSTNQEIKQEWVKNPQLASCLQAANSNISSLSEPPPNAKDEVKFVTLHDQLVTACQDDNVKETERLIQTITTVNKAFPSTSFRSSRTSKANDENNPLNASGSSLSKVNQKSRSSSVSSMYLEEDKLPEQIDDFEGLVALEDEPVEAFEKPMSVEAFIHHKSNEAFRVATREGHKSVMQLLLKHTADPIAKKQMFADAVISAVEQKHIPGLALALELIPNQEEKEQVLHDVLAVFAKNNQEEKMSWLLSQISDELEKERIIHSRSDQMFVNAGIKGHNSITKLLFHNVGIKAKQAMLITATLRMVKGCNEPAFSSLLELTDNLPVGEIFGTASASSAMALSQESSEIIQLFERLTGYQLIRVGCESASRNGNLDGLTMLLKHAEHNPPALTKLIAFSMEVAAKFGQTNIMHSLLERTTEPSAKENLIKIGFKHASQQGQSEALHYLLQPLSSEAKDALIHDNNDQPFRDASKNRKVWVMKVLYQNSSPQDKTKMLDLLLTLQPFALENDHADVLRFFLEAINPNPSRQSISSLQKRNSSSHLPTQEETSQLNKINEFFPLAVAKGSKKILELLFELINDKQHLKGLCEHAKKQNKALAPDMQALLNPDKAWKIGQELRKLHELGYEAEEINEMTALAMNAITIIKNEGAEGLMRIRESASTILSTEQVNLVCNLLTPHKPFMATIRSSKKMQLQKPAIDDVTTAEGKLTFLEKLVEQANKAANQNSLQGSAIV